MTNHSDTRIAWLILDLLWEFCPQVVTIWLEKKFGVMAIALKE